MLHASIRPDLYGHCNSYSCYMSQWRRLRRSILCIFFRKFFLDLEPHSRAESFTCNTLSHRIEAIVRSNSKIMNETGETSNVLDNVDNMDNMDNDVPDNVDNADNVRDDEAKMME